MIKFLHIWMSSWVPEVGGSQLKHQIKMLAIKYIFEFVM